jgi:hypothetical protein
MTKITRILEKTNKNGKKIYSLQQKYFYLYWAAAYVNPWTPWITSNFTSISEAKKHQQYLIGKKTKPSKPEYDIIINTLSSIKRNTEKINEITWKMYKEQILEHIQTINNIII